MEETREVYGIGSKKANELKKYYNIRTVSALRRYVRKIPEIITETQKTGLKYHDKISNPILRKLAEKHVDFIKKHIPTAIVAGSIRREESKINDIDIIVTMPLKKAITILTNANYIIDTFMFGDDRFSGVVKLPNSQSYRKIDIIQTTKEEKPFALLYFTGDFVQNITMRQKAKKKNYSLSQNGIKNLKTGRMITGIKSEKDIFGFLDIPYKEPHQRIHKGIEKKTLTRLSRKR